MRKLIAIIALFALMSLTLSAKSIPEKLDRFVDEAELKCDKYTSSDWEKSTSEYRDLVRKYYASRDEFSDAEKMMAARAMGRYHALLLKRGVNTGISKLSDIGITMPEYIKGFSGNVEGFNLNEALKDFFDKIDIEKALDDFGKTLEGIFGTPETAEPQPES